MKQVLYLAWRYLTYHRVKTVILMTSITLILYLPVGLRVLVAQSEAELTTRAQATPLIVGAKGSPLELCLNSLYFESDAPSAMSYAESERVTESGLALALPLHTRFRARGRAIVGTTLEYFAFRKLEMEQGRPLARLGECVLGAELAREFGLKVGDALVSSPESVFDLAGVYPLKMEVVGVLATAHSPDDRVVFVDLKTAWVIEGLGHGHQDLARPEAAPGVLRREGNKIVGNASVLEYNQITPENIDSFHFHGDLSAFSITGAIVVPQDEKASALFQGRYLGEDERVQVVRPSEVMGELLDTILTVQSYVITAVVVIGAATFATATLVFLLSLRLRRREIATIVKIGGGRAQVWGILASEMVLVIASSILFAGLLTAATQHFGPTLIRALILS